MPNLKRKEEVVTLARSNQILNAGLKAFADAISIELAPADLIAAFGSIKDTEYVVKDLNTNLRNRVLATLMHDGEVTSEKGSMRLEIDGVSIEARPQRAGFDAKKVEALLRAKQASVQSYMDQVVTYTTNDTKLQLAVAEGVMSVDELNTCKYDVSYALQRPKKVNENE